MAGGLSGSQKVEASVPEALNELTNVIGNRAVGLSEAGFMPYTQDMVAGLQPEQMAARANTNAAAAAFGMQQAPTSQMAGNHSTIGLYDQALADLTARAPGQSDYYRSFFIDPQTGVPGSRTSPYEFIGSKPDGYSNPFGGGSSGLLGSQPQNVGFGTFGGMPISASPDNYMMAALYDGGFRGF